MLGDVEPFDLVLVRNPQTGQHVDHLQQTNVIPPVQTNTTATP